MTNNGSANATVGGVIAIFRLLIDLRIFFSLGWFNHQMINHEVSLWPSLGLKSNLGRHDHDFYSS